jgi:chromosome segregation ATPase
MTTKTGTEARTAALKAARTRDSQDKRRRALAAIETLTGAGTTVTFAGVAKTAGVSSWLVYSEGIREHVDAARRRQADHGATVTAASPVDAKHRATPAGLRADLALARDEIRRLRAETDKLRARLRLKLGAEIEGPDRAQLIARVADLESANRQLVAERVNRNGETDAARRRVSELEDELTAVRESLRRVIRTENRGR